MSAVRNASGSVIRRFALRRRQRRRRTRRITKARPVVERALKPLRARGHQRVLLEDHEVARERAHALAPHRVPLVGHRARADLRRLKRLLDLLQVGEQPQVRRHLVRGRAEACQRCERVHVDLARVCLRRDWVRMLEAAQLRHARVERLDLSRSRERGPEGRNAMGGCGPCHGRHQRARGSSPACRSCP